MILHADHPNQKPGELFSIRACSVNPPAKKPTIAKITRAQAADFSSARKRLIAKTEAIFTISVSPIRNQRQSIPKIILTSFFYLLKE